MAKVTQDNFPRSINQHVPLMEFAADVVDGKHFINLGNPTIADPNGILAQANATNSATSYTSADWAVTFDGSSTHINETVAGSINTDFGRCLAMSASAGADHVVTITGRDYLGQIMSEAITLVNTVVVFGKKAFKFVDTVAVASGQSGDTFDLGWTDRLGLPYKAEKMLSYTEDDVSFPVDPVEVLVEIDAVRTASGADVVVVSPIAGQITGVHSVVTTSMTGIQTATVVVVAVDVIGLSLILATSAAVGEEDSDIITTDDDQATSRVDQFEAIGISGDGTPTGGAHTCSFTVEPIAYITADETDPATTTTTDTRGTILCTTPASATASVTGINYEVSYTVDTSNLHGLVQV